MIHLVVSVCKPLQHVENYLYMVCGVIRMPWIIPGSRNLSLPKTSKPVILRMQGCQTKMSNPTMNPEKTGM